MFIGVVAACPKLKRDPPVYVDPIVTRPFESITKVLAPPLAFENMTTFDPNVPGPTSRPLSTNTFVVEREFEAYRLFKRTNEFKFEIVETLRVPTFAVVEKTLVVERALVEYKLVKIPVRAESTTTVPAT